MNNQLTTSKGYFLREICATLFFTGILLTPVLMFTTHINSDDSRAVLKQRLETRLAELRTCQDFTNKTSVVYQEYGLVYQRYQALGDSIRFSGKPITPY